MSIAVSRDPGCFVVYIAPCVVQYQFIGSEGND